MGLFDPPVNRSPEPNQGPGMTTRVDGDGVAWVVFDRPGDKVNLLTATILQEMDRMLAEVSTRSDLRGLVFTSSKQDMFLAGMDVEQIADVTDSHRGAEGARFGQAVFQKIEDLKIPTACAIGGPCVGGGTELALACDFRVAADTPAVRVGLPEVKLGIIPGFGGTQRLPRLIGLAPSLDLIVAGKTLDAKRARRCGLVDLVVPREYLDREAAALVRRANADGRQTAISRVRRRLPLATRLQNLGPLRRTVLGQARKKTAAKISARDYPAPFRAIDSVEASFLQPETAGYDFEARVIGELIPGRTSKNLIWLFKTQNALKRVDAETQAAPRTVDRVAVLGAGIMGGGIAQLVADKSIPVRLKDLRYEAILDALRTANDVWQHKVRRRRMTQAEVARKMGFIAPTLDDTGLRQIDVVVEAVVEKLEVKQQVLAEVEQKIPERAIFASNTSSLPIADIAARALHPERVVGMHFFNPVHRMPLIEVIAGQRSSPEAVSTVRALAIRLGKVPVVVKDGPGFLVNRILTFYMNEAARLLAEGVRIDAIDRAMTSFGMPMGPLELLDRVGLDTASHVGEVLRSAFGQRVGGETNLLQTLVGAERLGKKNGRGIYRYDKQGRRTQPDPVVYSLIGEPAPRELPPETLQERMVLAMVNEASICLDEGVVRDPRDIDLAMVMGTGFPPFRGGLLRHADAVGIPIVADRLQRLADSQGPRFRPADGLQRMVREQRRFYG